RRFDAEDQHVLREPALLASHHRCDAKREALLPEKRVAAVTGAEGPDLFRLGVMDDVFVLLVARPGHVFLARRERSADRMHGGDELAFVAENVEHLPA